MVKLIADSGATKCEWCLITNDEQYTVFTQGISPYFFTLDTVIALLEKDLKPHFPPGITVNEIHYYGTGMRNVANVAMMKEAFATAFKNAHIEVNEDMIAAGRALNGLNEGIVCNLGTGSFACYYNGKENAKQSPGLGYILGDEGSGAYLGKKVLQYYLYKTFDEDLLYRFDDRYKTNTVEIFENVYRKPLANRYLANYALFLAENRGHYMIENIIEDGLNDFFFNHICKLPESWTLPIHFVGSIAFGFSDVIKELCNAYEFEAGTIVKSPMEGLVRFHK